MPFSHQFSHQRRTIMKLTSVSITNIPDKRPVQHVFPEFLCIKHQSLISGARVASCAECATLLNIYKEEDSETLSPSFS